MEKTHYNALEIAIVILTVSGGIGWLGCGEADKEKGEDTDVNTSVYQSDSVSVSQCISQTVYQSVSESVSQCISQSVHQSDSVSVSQ